MNCKATIVFCTVIWALSLLAVSQANIDRLCEKLVEEYFTCYNDEFKSESERDSYERFNTSILSRVHSRDEALDFYKTIFYNTTRCVDDNCHCLSAIINTTDISLWSYVFLNDDNFKLYKMWLNEIDRSLTPVQYDDYRDDSVVNEFCKKFDWKVHIMQYEETYRFENKFILAIDYCHMQPNLDTEPKLPSTREEFEAYLKCTSAVFNFLKFKPLVTRHLLFEIILGRPEMVVNDLGIYIEMLLNNNFKDTNTKRDTVWMSAVNDLYSYKQQKFEQCSNDAKVLFNNSHVSILNSEDFNYILLQFNIEGKKYFYKYNIHLNSQLDYENQSTIVNSNNEKLLELKYYNRGFIIFDYVTNINYLFDNLQYVFIRAPEHILGASNGLLIDGCNGNAVKIGEENNKRDGCETMCKNFSRVDIYEKSEFDESIVQEPFFNEMCMYYCDNQQSGQYFFEQLKRIYLPYSLMRLTDFDMINDDGTTEGFNQNTNQRESSTSSTTRTSRTSQQHQQTYDENDINQWERVTTSILQTTVGRTTFSGRTSSEKLGLERVTPTPRTTAKHSTNAISKTTSMTSDKRSTASIAILVEGTKITVTNTSAIYEQSNGTQQNTTTSATTQNIITTTTTSVIVTQTSNFGVSIHTNKILLIICIFILI